VRLTKILKLLTTESPTIVQEEFIEVIVMKMRIDHIVRIQLIFQLRLIKAIKNIDNRARDRIAKGD
jgi:hypothetical protein